MPTPYLLASSFRKPLNLILILPGCKYRSLYIIIHIFYLLLFIFSNNVNAESPIDKGVYSLSGSISFSQLKIDGEEEEINTFTLYPELVYFVFPNFAIGSSILYSRSTWGDLTSTAYGIGPIARYYLGKEKIYPFILLEYLFIKSEMEGGSVPVKYDRNDITLGFGIDYFLSKNVALEPIFRYVLRKIDYDTTSTSYTDSDEQEILIGIGINVFIF